MEASDLGLSLLQSLLQRLAAAKRGSPGAGADADTVLSDAVEIDHPWLQQRVHRMFEHAFQEGEILHAEIAEGVGVDGDAAREPAVGVVAETQVGQGACAGDASEGGIQPQGDENTGVDGGSAGDAAASANAVIQGREVKCLSEAPDGASGVVGLDEIVDGSGRKELLPIGSAQPGLSRLVGWAGP